MYPVPAATPVCVSPLYTSPVIASGFAICFLAIVNVYVAFAAL